MEGRIVHYTLHVVRIQTKVRRDARKFIFESGVRIEFLLEIGLGSFVAAWCMTTNLTT